MILAILAIVLANGQMEQHSLRVPSRLCGFHSPVEVPMNGGWVSAEAKVICNGRSR